MNKLKWNQFPKEIKINYPIILNDENKNIFTKFFVFGNKNLFLFIQDQIIVIDILLSSPDLSLNIFFSQLIQLKFITHNENITTIIQNCTIKSQFIIITSLHKLYFVEFSSIDYFYYVKNTINFNENIYKILLFIDSSIYVLLNGVIIKSNDYLKSREIVLSNENDVKQFEIINEYYVVFTSKNIKIININSKKTQIIYDFPNGNDYFMGKALKNKIFYIKSNDEFSIYDVDNQKNNSSLKFSSKKILNKINFDKIIFVNDDIIALTNQTEVELYIYSQLNNTFNRETSIIDNRNYLLYESFIICLGINLRNMTIKGKYCLWNKLINNKKLNYQNEVNKDNISSSLCSLCDIEEDYDKKKEIIVQIENKINRMKGKINKIIKIKINNYNSYLNLKNKIEFYLSSIHLLLYNSLEFPHSITIELYQNKIYSKLINKYRDLYGYRFILLNWKEIYLNYYINEALRKNEKLIKQALEIFDKETYKGLLLIYIELKKLLF